MSARSRAVDSAGMRAPAPDPRPVGPTQEDGPRVNASGLIAEAARLFLVTNIDDVVVLSLFSAQGAGQPGAARRVDGFSPPGQ